MVKTDIKLIVFDCKTSSIDYIQQLWREEQIPVWVEAYHVNDGYMVDSGVCEEFPELEELGLGDTAEGVMEHYTYTAVELAQKLTDIDFIVELGK